MTFNSDS